MLMDVNCLDKKLYIQSIVTDRSKLIICILQYGDYMYRQGEQ